MLQTLPKNERPRERALTQGATCLSLRELLAVILGSGTKNKSCYQIAEDLLDRSGKGLAASESERAFFHSMENSPIAHLISIQGLGPAGRAKLAAAMELGRRYATFRQEKTDAPKTGKGKPDLPNEAVFRIPNFYNTEAAEWLGFVPLFRTGQLGQFCLVERGVRTHVNFEPSELFARVLALRPAGFFLFHNHPTGDLTASEPDLLLTRQVAQLARQLGLQLMGHGIVSPVGHAWIARDWHSPLTYAKRSQ